LTTIIDRRLEHTSRRRVQGRTWRTTSPRRTRARLDEADRSTTWPLFVKRPPTPTNGNRRSNRTRQKGARRVTSRRKDHHTPPGEGRLSIVKGLMTQVFLHFLNMLCPVPDRGSDEVTQSLAQPVRSRAQENLALVEPLFTCQRTPGGDDFRHLTGKRTSPAFADDALVSRNSRQTIHKRCRLRLPHRACARRSTRQRWHLFLQRDRSRGRSKLIP